MEELFFFSFFFHILGLYATRWVMTEDGRTQGKGNWALFSRVWTTAHGRHTTGGTQRGHGGIILELITFFPLSRYSVLYMSLSKKLRKNLKKKRLL